MSHPHRRPSDYSRGSSPRVERTLSVTEASFQSLGLHETAGAQHLSVPSSYGPPSSRHRRPSYPRGQLDPNFVQPQYESYPRNASPASFSSLQPASAFEPPALDHSDFASFPETASFSGRTTPFSTSSLDSTNMSSYPYSSASTGGVYSGSSHYSSRSPSQRYPNPSTEASMSRSMFGPPGPNILPSSTFGEFRDVEREGARQRRRNNRQSRRENKMRLRRTMLPSIPDAVETQADVVSDSIDCFAAHSHSPYGSHSSYGRTSSSAANDSYIPSVHRSPYDSAFNDYAGSSVGPAYGSSSQSRLASSSSVTYPGYSDRGGSHAGSISGDPVVIETPKKPQCWEHGCNGRPFSTFSNLLRHQREKSGNSTKSVCHRCGAEFTRKTARDGHLAHDKCKPRGSSER